ncbi:DUF3757 domain-containing protein [Pseudomonas sp. TH49]|uniref:DUF3757 domain-containing protein n=1 Tax=Pseudomonas sp. TH49 TaxID=2796413 RepID=UPI00406D05CA
MLTFSAAEASNQYFDIPVWPGDEESCPTPRNIRNNGNVFSAPAKSESVGWIGMLPGDGIENVVSFEKAVFVLTQEYSDIRGLLSACIYAMSKGRYLRMRLGSGTKHEEIMWIVRSYLWRRSQDFSYKIILECTEKNERACGFFLK